MRLSPSSIAAALAASVTFAAAPAAADTLASSAISNSFSASVGSVSTSFNASSDASSPGRPLRTGQYRVVEIAAAPAREGYARVTLRPLGAAAAGGAEDTPLFLPQETVARAALAAGHFVTARERSYGLELAKAAAADEAPQTFFLVVDDERYRELQTRPVTL
jgi:hypothetical protein